MCASRDDPRIVTVTRESRDTLTGGVGVCVRVHPGIVTVSRESRDTLTGGSSMHTCASRDDPGMDRCSSY